MGEVESGARNVKKLLLLFAGVVLVLAVLVGLTVRRSAQRADRLDRTWEEEIFGGLEPPARFPPRQPNDTALALETLAAELGLHFSTPHHPVPAPEPAAAESWLQARELMQEHFDSMVASAAAFGPSRRLVPLGPSYGTSPRERRLAGG